MPTQITVSNGDSMFDSFLSEVYKLTPVQLRSPIQIQIENDAAVDAKGVFRSMMTLVADKLRNNMSKHIIQVNNGNVYFSPKGHSDPTTTNVFYEQLGRVVGLCLTNLDSNVRLGGCVSMPLCKVILGETLGFNDYEVFQKQTIFFTHFFFSLDYRSRSSTIDPPDVPDGQ